MSTILRSKRALLSACVSIAALAVASPSHAADMQITKSPIFDRGEFRAFVEGGAFWTGGDPIPYNGGFGAFIAALTGNPPAGAIPVARPSVGWDGAIGADYRFAGSPWHVNLQGRYGQVNKIDDNSDGAFTSSLLITAGGAAITAIATTTPQQRESHWQADFGMGYDFMRGAQINFGFRVAEIRSDIDAVTALPITVNGATVASLSLSQTDRRSFLGAGPRVGAEGSVPLVGPWSFDYSGNAAVLFGNTKFSTGQVLGVNVAAGGLALAINGIPLNQVSWSSPTTVYNFDIQGGIAYWFTPNMKLVLSYRLDAFIDALRIAPDDGATNAAIGPGRSMDRFYHGPKAALSARF
jgi:hypothetical protein